MLVHIIKVIRNITNFRIIVLLWFHNIIFCNTNYQIEITFNF